MHTNRNDFDRPPLPLHTNTGMTNGCSTHKCVLVVIGYIFFHFIFTLEKNITETMTATTQTRSYSSKGQGRGRDNRGSRGWKHDVSQVLRMSSFSISIFFSLLMLFTIRTTTITTNSHDHHHLH